MGVSSSTSPASRDGWRAGSKSNAHQVVDLGGSARHERGGFFRNSCIRCSWCSHLHTVRSDFCQPVRCCSHSFILFGWSYGEAGAVDCSLANYWQRVHHLPLYKQHVVQLYWRLCTAVCG
jgi:hypothetical protein